MKDSNWELINGEAAHEIEYINYTNTVNVIEALIVLYTGLLGTGPDGCPGCPTPVILNELHRTGTLFLLTQPGAYRENYNVNVYRPDGSVAHAAPPWEAVAAHMKAFHEELEANWATWDPITAAAFALWKVNWVHPFKNGNGRSARAFSYACLCLKLGFFLPGAPTVLDQIMMNRGPYEAALKTADLSFADAGTPDLEPMKAFLSLLLINQLSSVPPAGGDDIPRWCLSLKSAAVDKHGALSGASVSSGACHRWQRSA